MPTLPLMTPAPLKSVNVLRSFAFISLVAIVVAIMVLAFSFRSILIESVRQQGEASNRAVAQAVLQTVHDDVATFLLDSENSSDKPFPPAIASPMQELVADTAVSKVKIYDQKGDVVFSTRLDEIGHHQADNPGVIAALSGRSESKLVYRDTFNRFDGVTEDDNLIQTYLPILAEPGGRPVGVLEIYTDVSAMIALGVRYEAIIALTSFAIMIMLYVSLLVIVRRIERIVIVQREALRDRSTLLAALSTRMLNTHEVERQRISSELHECVAQTISAIKLGVESSVVDIRRGKDPTPMLDTLIPTLQAATQEVRQIALTLYPPSLSELGLLPTLRWRCAKVAEAHPKIDTDIELNIPEEIIPENVRAILYRVVDDVCSEFSENDAINHMMLSLTCDSNRIILNIGDDTRRGESSLNDVDQPCYRAARERILLSGGKYTLLSNGWGGMTMQAAWLM